MELDTADRALSRCLSVDLEVSKKTERIHAFAGVRHDTGQSVVFSCGQGSDFDRALVELDDLADGADFLLGHNLIKFDRPRLQAAGPGLRLLKLPVVDTLWLNPLAFPHNPYHHLVKHYQAGQIKRERRNDPELDAKLALDVFANQQQQLREAPADLVAAWHWLTGDDAAPGFDRFFEALRGSPRPGYAQARDAIRARLDGCSCATHGRHATADAAEHGWALAYALAWLSVSGGNSVMPPWVRHQFPGAGRLVRRLRDEACADPGCGWCRQRHDASGELKRFFGFGSFRPEPADSDGRSMQQAVVEAAMGGDDVLAILPTGTGKSLCYQIPALSRYDKTGALTVVISPLVALMADQVAGLEKRGITSCVTVNGLLSMPEASRRARQGEAGRRRDRVDLARAAARRWRCAAPCSSARSEPGCSTRPTACRSGAMTSVPTTDTWGASSARGPTGRVSRRCCASQRQPNPTSKKRSSPISAGISTSR